MAAVVASRIALASTWAFSFARDGTSLKRVLGTGSGVASYEGGRVRFFFVAVALLFAPHPGVPSLVWFRTHLLTLAVRGKQFPHEQLVNAPLYI